MKNKRVFVRFTILLGLVLLLMLLSSNTTKADPPDPPPSSPPTPDWGKQEPVFPPPEGEPWSPSIATQGVVRTFNAVADAEVRQGNPNTNYGIDPFVGAGYDNVVEHRLKHRALLDFNTTTYLPPGTVIHQATLRLYMSGYCDYVYQTSYRAYRIANGWSEMGVTWNNQPSFAEGYGSRLIPASPAWGYYNFDVTNLVQTWFDGSYPEYGIMIRGPESPPYDCAYRDFRSKGGGGFTSAPQLVVDYTLPAPAVSASKNVISIFHQCGVGAPDPAPQTIEVQSNNVTLNDWTTSVTGGGGWLSLNKTNGKVSQIFPDHIELSVSETGACPSTLTAEIEINAPGLNGSSKTVEVTFQQSADPPNLVYLPIILKNGGSVLSSNNTSIGVTSSTADRIILLIGVADYQSLPAPAQFSVLRSHQGNKTQDLLAPLSDLGALEMAFENPYNHNPPCDEGLTTTAENQPQSQSTIDIILSLPEEYATKANIEYALEWIDEREDANTHVLIYFSGHGGPTGVDSIPVDESDGMDEMIGVYDSSFTPILTNPVIDDSFNGQLTELETEHLAVILDACNSGGMEVTHPHRAVLAASREDQNSWESSELEHGVFTYYMLEAIHNPAASDTNGDGWVSVQEIYNYANNPVYNYIWNSENVAQNLYYDATTEVNVAQCGCP